MELSDNEFREEGPGRLMFMRWNLGFKRNDKRNAKAAQRLAAMRVRPESVERRYWSTLEGELDAKRLEAIGYVAASSVYNRTESLQTYFPPSPSGGRFGGLGSGVPLTTFRSTASAEVIYELRADAGSGT